MPLQQLFAKVFAPILFRAVGAPKFGVNVVDNVVALMPSESVRLDSDRLGSLFQQMTAHDAEEMVCRAVEELAVRLSHCTVLWRQDDVPGLRKSARSIIAIAGQIGMSTLARVALDVTQTVDRADRVATAAVVLRLERIGEASLNAVWDLQDLSV